MPERAPAAAACAAAAALAALVVATSLWPRYGSLLDWDEASYVAAARLGAWANMADRGSLPPADFARFGLAKWRGQAAVLPAGYDETRDPLLLRNLHPPFTVL